MPDYIEARLELGLVELRAGNYEAALSSFVQIPDVPPEAAPTLFNGLAFAYAQTGNLVEARKQALTARKWDRQMLREWSDSVPDPDPKRNRRHEILLILFSFVFGGLILWGIWMMLAG